MGSQQSARQLARRAALDAQARMRAERAEQEKRCSALGVVVVQALAERNATRSACEQRAGEALRALVEEEGLTLSAAVVWCGGELSAREAARLRRLASPAEDGDGDEQLAANPRPVGAGAATAAEAAGTKGAVTVPTAAVVAAG